MQTKQNLINQQIGPYILQIVYQVLYPGWPSELSEIKQRRECF